MKLTVGMSARAGGFALPTILLVSTVMMVILVASIAAAAASRVSLDSQYYNLLAKQAAQSGIARANECLQSSGYTPQWSTVGTGRDLRPNSTCAGTTMGGGGVSEYVVGDGVGPDLNIRTKYSIEAPIGSGIGSILEVVGTTELVRASPPHTVWRSYEQSLYHRIEPPQAVACPEGFAAVPGDSRFDTSDFCIGKFEAKNVGGTAKSQAGGTPYTSISQAAAADAAELSCAGCHLVTQGEWLTVMHNSMNVASNWTGEIVGSGSTYRGHSDNNPSNALAASTDDGDGYFGTNNSSGNQRRTLRLSNGEVVWDMAGNVWEWTDGTVSGGQPGLPGYAWREWNTGGMNLGSFEESFPSFATPAASAWTSSHGIGRLYSDSDESGQRGIERGSFWNGGSNAGIATLNFNDAPTTTNNALGFRIAFVPISETNCPDGYIPVPGNSLFNTNNFCVAKYETKDDGGNYVSESGGLPLVNVSQIGAVINTVFGSCGCSVISDAEWLTIAHNLANVPSNWTGGSVGSGTIYRGHTDNSPSTRLAASSDDDNGYYGTSNASGNQRRTLTLSNGEVIWDFSGNVWEWTSSIMSGNQPGGGGWAWREWNTINNTQLLSPDPSPIFGNPAAEDWNFSDGIGKLYSNNSYTSSRAFLRSGNWSDSNGYGLFSLALNRATNTGHGDAGFRLVVRP